MILCEIKSFPIVKIYSFFNIKDFKYKYKYEKMRNDSSRDPPTENY